MAETAETSAIRFRDPAQALRWAEEFAARGHYHSAIAGLGMPHHGVGPSYYELLDIAHTIAVIARNAPAPRPALTFLVAHHPRARVAVAYRVLLAPMLAEALAQCRAGEDASAAQCQALAVVALADLRRFKGSGERRGVPRVYYARALGWPPQYLYRAECVALIDAAAYSLDIWYAEARAVLVERLDELGVL